MIARTANFSASTGQPYRYFAPTASPAEGGGVYNDPTVRSNGQLRTAARAIATTVHKGFEIELESAVPAGGSLEVELIVEGQTTGIKATIAAGQTVGNDFAATQTISAGELFCYRFYPIGFTNCPGATITAIVE